jgi:hypothetical protein
MVIHDMRNPTNSIEFAVKEVLKLLTYQMSGQIVNYQREDSVINPIQSWKMKSTNFQRVSVCNINDEEHKSETVLKPDTN